MSEPAAEYALEAAALSDTGTERDHNEDHCGCLVESATASLVAVADGVSGYEGGEVASRMAIEVLLRSYQEQPATLKLTKRLYRAVQQANIEIYDTAVVVPELRRMATTLTALAVDRGELTCAHVGDTRLYRVHGREITQLTKDHTVVGERMRLGLLSAEEARRHPDRSTLTRNVGRELIVSIDTLTMPLATDDLLIVCSDGLYNTLEDPELEEVVRGKDAAGACRALIDAANARGTYDNVTAAVVRMTGPTPGRDRPPSGLVGKLRRMFAGASIA